MRIWLTLFGIVTIFIGLLPYLTTKIQALSKIPSSGIVYQAIIVIVGAIALIYGIRSKTKYV